MMLGVSLAACRPLFALVGTEECGLLITVEERSLHGDAVLTVRSILPGLVAERTAVLSSEYGPTLETLSDFFTGMARDWRGWKGDRLFQPVNQEVTITARHDGHVRLEVEVRGWEGEADWKAEGAVVLDAGEQLCQAEADVVEFVEALRRPSLWQRLVGRDK